MREERLSNRNEEQFTRQADIVPQGALSTSLFTIIGAGSLGSLTANCLAMLGAENIQVFDDDVVEIHNLAVQLYPPAALTDPPTPKVDALYHVVKNLHGVEIVTNNKKFTADTEVRGVVISCVDSMDARKVIWDNLSLQPGVPLYIDTRAGGRLASIFSLDPSNRGQVKDYTANWLFPQEEGTQGPCTEKMTTFISWAVGGQVAALVTNYLRKDPVPYRVDLDMFNMSTTPYDLS